MTATGLKDYALDSSYPGIALTHNWNTTLGFYLFAWSVFLGHEAFGQTFTIYTLAGGGAPQDVPALSAGISEISGITTDAAGNTYLALIDYNVVVQIDKRGLLTIVAGNGQPGFSGDNGPATSASLREPWGLAVDKDGSLFIADYRNARIRRVSPQGIITTIAGSGASGESLRDGVATEVALNGPAGIAVNASGEIYFADTDYRAIRKISGGKISTIAGSGVAGFRDGPATEATLATPVGVAVDTTGNVFFSDYTTHVIAKVSGGTLTKIAGVFGNSAYTGDNGPATQATLSYPASLAVDANGNIFVSDSGNDAIRKISAGTISTVAGTGVSGFSGDGGLARVAQLFLGGFPSPGISLSPSGDLLISDFENHRIRKVSNGVISTIAGNGTLGYEWGDNGPATMSSLYQPQYVAVSRSGNIYVADVRNDRVRKISNGIITTVAGNGTVGYSGDGGAATSAALKFCAPGFICGGALAVDSKENLYIADLGNYVIREVSNGIIRTIGGTGTPGFSGEGNSAKTAQIGNVFGLATDREDNLYLSDGARIRKIKNGVITTVAGTGVSGYSGDDGPATQAQLNLPIALSVDNFGAVYVADQFDNRIRKIANGNITTVAGTGQTFGVLGDNGPAVLATVSGPLGVATDDHGNVFISDDGNRRIRKVDSSGIISTIAGDGTNLLVNNVNATQAGLDGPTSIALGPTGSLYFVEYNTALVRSLVPVNDSCTYSLDQAFLVLPSQSSARTVTIRTEPSCSWAIAGLPLWLGAKSEGIGSATINFYAIPNLGDSLRTVTISLAGVPLNVSQAGGASIAPPVVATGAFNSASFATSVAPGSIASIFGNFSIEPQSAATTFSLPTGLSGLSLQVGARLQAPLFYGSQGQINFQVPWEASSSEPLQITPSFFNQTGPSRTINLVLAAPGIFSMNGQGSGQGAILDASYRLVDSSNPAGAGDVIQVYCTGLGAVTNAPATGSVAPNDGSAQTLTRPTVTIGGMAAAVLFSGLAPGAVGEYQVNVRVPSSSSSGPAVPVSIAIGGAVSNVVTIAVK